MLRKLAFCALLVTAALVLGTLGAVIPANTGQAQLADAPWPKFRGDAQNTGRSPYAGPEVPGLKWSFTTDGGIESSPAVGADGTIYVGSGSFTYYGRKLYAINPDGSQKWSFTTEGGVPSSPAVGADGTIYVGSYDNNLYAINPDGTEKWRFDTGDWVQSSPAIDDDGTIYVGSGGNWNDKLYAVNPDGTEKWSFTAGSGVWSSPAIGADGTIYVGSGLWHYSPRNLYAINPDGSQKWSFSTSGHVPCSPSIGTDGTIYVGSYDNKLYAVNPDGTEKWSFSTSGSIWSSPAVGADGTIYVGSHDYKLYAINPDGTEKWSFNTGGLVSSSPAVGADGTIYVGSRDNALYAINPDGTEKWSFTTGGGISSSPAVGADGTIYVGSRDAKVYAITEAEPEADFSAQPWSGGAPLAVQFSDESYAYITEWLWDFGDGTASTERNPTHTYAVSGVYMVSLTVSGPGGSDAKTLPITVLFDADFTSDKREGLVPLTVAFRDESVGQVANWLWDFGDGQTSTEQNPTHTYSTSGVYSVSLTIRMPGDSDTATKSDYISVRLEADFASDETEGFAPLMVEFTDESPSQAVNWLWDFGDGQTSTEQNPTHTYSTSGVFTVSLTISDPGGANAKNRSDYITVIPKAGFTADKTEGSVPFRVQFTDQSAGQPTAWLWDFGDGATGDEQNPIHTYHSPGTYDVTLKVEGAGGSNTETKRSFISVAEARTELIWLWVAIGAVAALVLAIIAWHFVRRRKA